MSKEAAAQWIKKLHEDEALRKEAEAAGNFEARQSLAGEHGFAFVKEEIEAVISEYKAQLSDEDLDAVSGGVTDGMVVGTASGSFLLGFGMMAAVAAL